MAPGAMAELGHLFCSQYFGEGALVRGMGEARTASATAQTPLVLFTLSERDFYGAFEDVSAEEWDKAGTTPEDELERVKMELGKVKQRRRSDPSIAKRQDLRIIRTIGRGTYGRVYLVRHTWSGKSFAFKCMNIKKIEKLSQQKHISDEAMVMDGLSQTRFPFVSRLHQVYRDHENVYMLTDAALGGDMYTRLREGHALPIDDARFYAAQIAITLHFVHRLDLLHRDLKPENLLLTPEGFLRVVDWGLCKRLEGPTGRTKTFCGTPIYAAPELFANVGHSKGVDYWSLGILIHEMVTGRPPFWHLSVLDMHQELARFARHYPRIRFPDRLQSNSKARHLVVGLLHPQPRKRIGCRCRGARELLCHEFFEGINWEDLLLERPRSQPEGLWKPDKELTQYDATHFDEFDAHHAIEVVRV
jgi:serine/threonine protein kinase